MKTVIQVFTQNIKNNKDYWGYWGLGDLIRGTIHLHQLSKKLNFNLIVDYQLHPIANFLKNNNHVYSDLIKQNKNNIMFIDQNCAENYIINNKNDIIYFLTNDFYKEEITQDTKDFIKKILETNESFNSDLINIKNKLNCNFNILHFRFGDIEIKNEKIKNDKNKDEKIILFLEMLKNITFNNLLITDSEIFKQKIKILKNINTLDTKITHLGYDKNFNNIKDTLLEFFIMIYSSKIYTYSIFNHNNGISGFVYFINKIYDIPIICIIYNYDNILNNKIIIHEFLNFNNFDWELYIQKYDDLKNAYINTKNKAWEHWVKFGKKEKRYFLCN